MLPIEAMQGIIDYQMRYDQGFTPQATIQAKIEERQQALDETHAAIAPKLKEILQEAETFLQDILQKVQAIDPYKAAQPQMEEIEKKIETFDGICQKASAILEQAQQHLSTQRQNNATLQRQLSELRAKLEQKKNADPFHVFLNQVGRRSCRYISNPDYKEIGHATTHGTSSHSASHRV